MCVYLLYVIYTVTAPDNLYSLAQKCFDSDVFSLDSVV